MINTVQNVSSLSLTRGLDLLDLGKVSDSQKSQSITPGAQTGQSFTEMLGNMTTESMDTLKKAETASFDGIKGKANTREVVDAVMNAEQSLQTAIALRDKIVSAFLDVTKMQI